MKLTRLLKQLLEEQKKKADRCKRIADRKYDKPSAYKSGAIVRCRKGEIWKDLKEDLLNEYSDKIIAQLTTKFKTEKPDLDDNIITAYINRFSQIKDSNNVSQKDITKYTWNDLEKVISDNQPKRVKAGKLNDGEPSKDANLVYNQNNLRIYAGATKEACIKYGNGYSFCISSRGEGNAYASYRFDEKGTPYFIFDDTKSSKQNKDKSFIDPNHLLVLFTYKPEEDFKYDEVYTITNANNDGDKVYNNFNEIEKDHPRLKGLKNIFQLIEDYDSKDKAEYDLKWEYNDKISELGLDYYRQKLKGKHYQFRSITTANKDIDGVLKNVTSDNFSTNKKAILLQYLQDVKKLVDQYRGEIAKIRLVKEIIKEIIQEDESLHKWFKRKGTPGKEGGWVDCNTCRNGKCKPCGRKKGEKRAKYPSCRPTPAQCKTKGKGKKWGKTK